MINPRLSGKGDGDIDGARKRYMFAVSSLWRFQRGLMSLMMLIWKYLADANPKGAELGWGGVGR